MISKEKFCEIVEDLEARVNELETMISKADGSCFCASDDFVDCVYRVADNAITSLLSHFPPISNHCYSTVSAYFFDLNAWNELTCYKLHEPNSLFSEIMSDIDRPIETEKTGHLIYVGGDIMGRGAQLARQEECDKIDAIKLDAEYYSPALNKSINDKANMTEEENNHLAEKICEADIDRLWNSDIAVMCAEQNAVGTLCEIGVLYGWKYMANKLIDICRDAVSNEAAVNLLCSELVRIATKTDFFHCADIRTNHLNEKDWRRSFSINQLLYGMILYASIDNKMNESFDDVLNKLKSICGTKDGE